MTLLEQFKNKIQGIEINPEGLIIFLKYAMEIVETTQLKGQEQKDKVLYLLTTIITDSELSMEKKELYCAMVKNGYISKTIDVIVDATKGKLKINTKNIFCSCFSYA